MLMLTMILVVGTMGSAFANGYVPTLTVSVYPNPSGTATGSVTWIADGMNSHWKASISATNSVDNKYTFEKWQAWNMFTSSWFDLSLDQSDSFTIYFDSTVRAVFTENHMFSYTLDTAEMGGYTGDQPGYYKAGDPIVGAAAPMEGYRLASWEFNGTSHPATDPINLTMPDYDANLILHFEAIPSFNLTTAVTPEGGGTVTAGGTYPVGTPITLVPVPERGYVFNGWDYGQANITPTFGPNDAINFAMPEEHLTVTAMFMPLEMSNVMLIPSPADKGNPTLDENALPGDEGFDGAYYMGETFQVMPNPIANWHFVGYDYEYMCPEVIDARILPEFEKAPQIQIEPSYDSTDPNEIFTAEECDLYINVYYEENAFVWATPHYLNNVGNELQPAGAPVKVYLDTPYSVPHPDMIGSWKFAYTLNNNDAGTLGDGAEDFDVYFYYYLPEVVTNTVTNTVTETVVVTVPATTEPTTEVLPTEPVPLGAAKVINFDSIYDNMEMPTTEEITLPEEETPLADALPQTGQLPVELFYGIGGLVSAVGVFMKRKPSK